MRLFAQLYRTRFALMACLLAAPVHINASEIPVTKGVFLVASDHLRGTRFAKSVILITQVDEHGAMGLAINKRSQRSLKDSMPNIHDEAGAIELFFGGPVHPQALFVLARPHPGNGWISILGETGLSGGPVAYHYLMKRQPIEPKVESRAYAGYAGWAPGQLRTEIERGDWHVLPGDQQLIFSVKPEDLWDQLSKNSTGKWL